MHLATVLRTAEEGGGGTADMFGPRQFSGSHVALHVSAAPL